MTDLAAFLAAAAARPLEWGRCDCCLVVADWVAACVGVDPAADLRGTYADERCAARTVEMEGGLVSLFERRLAHAGLVRTDMMRLGDVAVVTIAKGPDLFGAIAGPTGWAIKTMRGLVLSRMPKPVACWTFRNG